MIVGTAGHIDHGKTSLVRALSGVDTDRLQEEKARGISIELGHAYVPLADGGVLGFVDVPGHRRFVHTMVTGATGIDLALLVVAADDGPMPQTREHLAILDLLGVAGGVVALSKVDRVDAARLEAARAEVAALLATSPLREAPVFACNATDPDDAGIAALRAHLHARAAQPSARPRDGELFRLPVDRIFSLPGHGTVVAGPVAGGRVAVGDVLQRMPGGEAVRVRGLHAQGQAATAAGSGQRAALNLAGIGREAVTRGDWIADPRLFKPSRHVDARLRLLPGSGAVLRDGLKLHVHWGSGHRRARVLRLQDGDAGTLVQLVFDVPVCATTGDRFIARDESAAATVGGGILLDPEASPRRRRRPERIAWLQALEDALAGEGVTPLLAQAPHGIAFSTLERRLRVPSDRIALPEGTRVAAGHAIRVDRWQALAERIAQCIRDWHARHPDDPGPDAGRLQRLAFPGLEPAMLTALLQALQEEGRVQRLGAWWQLPGHAQRDSERDAALLAQLLPRLEAGGFDPPWVRTLATDTGTDEALVRAVLRRAGARGEVHQVVQDLFYHPRRVAELAALLARLAAAAGDGAVEAAAFRDAIGIGRKRSIQVLEFFDRAGYTRRVGAGHRPRGSSRWGDASSA